MITFDIIPDIVSMEENDVVSKFKNELVGISVWSPIDLQEWLEDQGLTEYESENYTNHLIDHILDEDLGYEYGGITPWMGEGYSLYWISPITLLLR